MTSQIALVHAINNFQISTSQMDDVFGQGNWQDQSLTNLVLSDFKSIYLDGNDSGDFANWISTHTADLETWVSNGGKLFINTSLFYSGGQPTSLNLGFNLSAD